MNEESATLTTNELIKSVTFKQNEVPSANQYKQQTPRINRIDLITRDANEILEST